ncbi:MAG: 2,4'-dihydroxyacetophenone dioxygenase family protein [Pseudomonadota bacterium]|nr:2,4'-dihydroxyacetophenone dioxygenase family protein [Pseudomonadota bacterium]
MAVNLVNLGAPKVPEALHRGSEELPWARFCDGVQFQLLQVDVEAGLWVVRIIFEHGVTIQQHKHTGEVYAVTFSGAWKYLEYPDTINTAFSYLYEPAGSIHTLTTDVADASGLTDVWFAIQGANLNLDSEGKVESIVDAGSILALYREECEQGGLPVPNIIGAN